MTDEQINTEVARILGWGDFSTHSGILFGSMPSPHIEDDRMPVPDYCNDPAAWGALFGWLRAHEWGVSLIARSEDTVEARAKHRYKRGYFGMAEDPLPGRALALAALRAHGVTP